MASPSSNSRLFPWKHIAWRFSATFTDGASPAAGAGVDAGQLGTLPKSPSGNVVTYHGWPLYRYAADTTAGEHSGQDVFLNDGNWYVMKPDGEPLIPSHEVPSR
ncbi:hypothetical protein ACFC09_35030 [Streptomyces sp. NPDC056161]|uniref:hypothetical protein n=1 Tax=Streptomyces sp. NPDC056161 TaxID=3345732 RepID=UPI0035D90E92